MNEPGEYLGVGLGLDIAAEPDLAAGDFDLDLAGIEPHGAAQDVLPDLLLHLGVRAD